MRILVRFLKAIILDYIFRLFGLDLLIYEYPLIYLILKLTLLQTRTRIQNFPNKMFSLKKRKQVKLKNKFWFSGFKKLQLEEEESGRLPAADGQVNIPKRIHTNNTDEDDAHTTNTEDFDDENPIQTDISAQNELKSSQNSLIFQVYNADLSLLEIRIKPKNDENSSQFDVLDDNLIESLNVGLQDGLEKITPQDDSKLLDDLSDLLVFENIDNQSDVQDQQLILKDEKYDLPLQDPNHTAIFPDPNQNVPLSDPNTQTNLNEHLSDQKTQIKTQEYYKLLQDLESSNSLILDLYAHQDYLTTTCTSLQSNLDYVIEKNLELEERCDEERRIREEQCRVQYDLEVEIEEFKGRLDEEKMIREGFEERCLNQYDLEMELEELKLKLDEEKRIREGLEERCRNQELDFDRFSRRIKGLSTRVVEVEGERDGIREQLRKYQFGELDSDRDKFDVEALTVLARKLGKENEELRALSRLDNHTRIHSLAQSQKTRLDSNHSRIPSQQSRLDSNHSRIPSLAQSSRLDNHSRIQSLSQSQHSRISSQPQHSRVESMLSNQSFTTITDQPVRQPTPTQSDRLEDYYSQRKSLQDHLNTLTVEKNRLQWELSRLKPGPKTLLVGGELENKLDAVEMDIGRVKRQMRVSGI
jgi:hypothetical protein